MQLSPIQPVHSVPEVQTAATLLQRIFNGKTVICTIEDELDELLADTPDEARLDVYLRTKDQYEARLAKAYNKLTDLMELYEEYYGALPAEAAA